MIDSLRFISKILESLRYNPTPPVAVSVATEHVTDLPLSSGAGKNVSSDVVTFPSMVFCRVLHD